MGSARWRPQRLAEKLRQIRLILDLSQSALLTKLGVADEISYNRISDYELDRFDPPLPVLVEYARVARVHLEEIVDDRLDLPTTLPGTVKYQAWKTPRPRRSRKKRQRRVSNPATD
jgi:transcriptional regulator with XRE-family HTH domain